MNPQIGLYSNVFQLSVNKVTQEVIIDFAQASNFTINENKESIMDDTAIGVAKIIMTPQMAKQLIEVLQDCLDRKDNLAPEDQTE